MRSGTIAGLAVLLGFAPAVGPAAAQGTPDAPAELGSFVTLGTMGGPVGDGRRSQPANALIDGKDLYLVDVGDGTVQQLAKAGLPLRQVKAVFLSHLHADHTAGLSAVLALRNQTLVTGRLTIFGPPGTQELASGLIAAMRPAASAGYGIPGKPWPEPAASVTVVELTDGSALKVGSMMIRAAQNSHYDFVAGSPEDRAFKSLSLRFELAGRTIVYTGDTGPSPAVESLATGADLLVSEMIDIEATMATVARNTPNMPEPAKKDLVRHLTTHHLTPSDVGKLARRAGVKAVVVTHFAGGTESEEQIGRAAALVRTEYTGPVAMAKDLDRF